MSADLNPKKRKRDFSTDDADDRPSAKHARSESPFRDAEDHSLSPSDAHKVLTVLEAVDTDSLLDRLLTYPDAGSRVTMRDLLRDSANYSLRFIRSALNQLLPISSQPRSLLATGASNQQRFVEFGQSLFNEAVARKTASALAKRDSESVPGDEEETERSLPVEDRKRKYALLQRLPTGDWWSSSTIPREGDVGLTRAAARALVTKQAELVSIIPSQPIPADEMPTFATLKPPSIPLFTKTKEETRRQSAINLPHRTLPAPKLLDYGVYSTFAPSFDSENTEIGTDQIHQLVHESLQRRKARALRKQLIEKQRRLAEVESSMHDPAMGVSPEKNDEGENAVVSFEKDDATGMASAEQEADIPVDGSLIFESTFPSDEVLQNLQNVIPQDEVDVLKQAFEALRVEFGVSALLEHIATGLDNLVDLQQERFRDGVPTPGDLEREIANAVQKSLAYAISLRPRSSSHPDVPVTPSTEILRTLQRSLPAEPTSGYRGTLSTTRPTSLRDDATMYVKATAKAQAAASAAAATSTPSQMNGTPRAPGTPAPSTPVPQAPQYHTPPFHNNPNPSNPMAYGYPPPGYPSPGMPPTTGGATRVMPNLLNAKSAPMTPGAQWPAYAGAAPPFFGKGPPMTPVRANSSYYKQ